MRLVDADELVRRFSDSKSGKTLKTMVNTQPTVENVYNHLAKHDSELLDKVAHELKETFNIECPINYTSTQPFFTLENVRTLVDMVIAELKAEVEKI